MIAFRIADARFPIFDGTGAMLRGARWNSPGQPVIYAAETYAGAMLEILVHANLSSPPKNQRVVRISIPEKVAIETAPAAMSRCNDVSVTREFGDLWLKKCSTAVLRVPSIVTEGRENNILINPLHKLFRMISASEPEPVQWDSRLFSR